MKLQLKRIFVVMSFAIAFTSCSSDDSNSETTGKLVVEFDNVYKAANFAFNTEYTNSNGEKVKVTTAKYIVSNIVLTKTDGSTFVYPKNDSYFIVDESNLESTELVLNNVPVADYKSIKFGIGVDQERWQQGVEAQGNFWAEAQAADMEWGWTAGYKYVNLEGTFTTPSNATASQFQAHTGRSAENYNYTEISLNFHEGENALVRGNNNPQIHIMADLSHILDGTNKINLSEGASIHGGVKMSLMTQNLSNMFTVDHIHND